MPLFGKRETQVKPFHPEQENSKLKKTKKSKKIKKTSTVSPVVQGVRLPVKREVWGNNKNNTMSSIKTPLRGIPIIEESPNTSEKRYVNKAMRGTQYKRRNSSQLPPIMSNITKSSGPYNFVNETNTKKYNSNDLQIKKHIRERKLVLSDLSLKKKMQKYCNILYKYLKDTNTCFIKGTFVIDDKNDNLKKLLLDGSSEFNKLRKVFASHQSFGPYSVKKAKKLKEKPEDVICKSTSGICEINLNDVELVDVYCSDKYKDSDNDHFRQKKANIKFYFFNNTDTKPNNQRFVFFKLERFKTISGKHALFAARRYIIRSAQDNVSSNNGVNGVNGVNGDDEDDVDESELDEVDIEESNSNNMTEMSGIPLIRREDCNIDQRGCVCKNLDGLSDEPQNCENKYVNDPESIVVFDSHQEPGKCLVNYDKHKRMGDEYFVNVKVNDRIVEMVQNNEPIDNFKARIC